jgi:hypothetical protein
MSSGGRSEQAGYCVSGRFELTIGDQTAAIGPDDGYVIPGGTRHSHRVLKGSPSSRLVLRLRRVCGGLRIGFARRVGLPGQVGDPDGRLGLGESLDLASVTLRTLACRLLGFAKLALSFQHGHA